MTINDHGLARDTGSHLIGTEWTRRTSWGRTYWRVMLAMYGVLRLREMHGNIEYHTVDELLNEMQRVEGGT